MILIVIVIVIFGGLYYYKATSNNKISYALRPEANKVEDINDVQQVVHTNTTKNENQTSTVIPWTEPNNTSIQNIDTSNQNKNYKHNNRYYYDQLEAPSKALYDAVENNLEELKKGTCRINLNYDFSDILKNNDSENALKPYYDDAMDALSLDIPNLFYVDFLKLYLFVETRTTIFSTKYTTYLSTKNGINIYKEGFYNEEQVNEAINQINDIKANIINRAYENDYYKVRYVHDWLIENMEYDNDEISKSSVYGALVDKKGVCEAYARTYKYILDELGVNNVLATGTATNSNGDNESHMWNYVLLNGKWYAVDVTWDDPIVIGGGILSSASKHRYFLVGSNKFFENHFENNTITSQGRQFALPKLQTGDYK